MKSKRSCSVQLINHGVNLRLALGCYESEWACHQDLDL